jgi:Family of unknown function (DUF6069)
LAANYPNRTSRIELDPRSLWAGGLAASVVAALVAVVGIVICRGVFKINILAPKGHGTWGDASTVVYAVCAFVAGLVATALIQVLYRFTPSPGLFFAWIVGLLTLFAVVIPFPAVARRADQIATAVLNLLIGLAIYSLVSTSADRSRRPAPPPGYGSGGYRPPGYGG